MRLALAGDTMLGRGVGERLREAPPDALFAPEVVEAARSADIVIANLECCISERGEPAPHRVFHFRAPPAAADALAYLGVDCVTLANNHALDYGRAALLDTFRNLDAAGIHWVGAGREEAEARAPLALDVNGTPLRIVAFSDHPREYAARQDTPGIAFADLASGAPQWLLAAICDGTGPVLVCPHWGPNMTAFPLPEVRRAAHDLVAAGATLVAGHSAHVFHGVADRVLFDLGDFMDDYRVDPVLRNDLGVLWFVELEGERVARIEALPLKLEFCFTRIADGDDRAWIARRLREACAELGSRAEDRGERIAIAPG